jgi:hypothetical protein
MCDELPAEPDVTRSEILTHLGIIFEGATVSTPGLEILVFNKGWSLGIGRNFRPSMA